MLTGTIYSLNCGVALPIMFKTMLPIFLGKEQDAAPAVVNFAKILFGEVYSEKLLILACVALPLPLDFYKKNKSWDLASLLIPDRSDLNCHFYVSSEITKQPLTLISSREYLR